MSGVYIYISKTKVSNLYNATRGGKSMGNLAVRLKAPWVEAEVTATHNPGHEVYRMLQKIRKRLEVDPSIILYQDLEEDPVSVIKFAGQAAIGIADGTFWLALAEGNTALLLAGSAANLISGVAATSAIPERSDIASASDDPVGASLRSLEGIRSESVSSGLSFRWQQLHRNYDRRKAVLRHVQGYSIFGGVYPANRTQLRRVGAADIKRIAVASPIYVEQI